MGGDGPLISVITPCYNQRSSILWMLQAWKMQTAFSFELIISDDGSNDGTLDAVNRVKGQLPYKVTFIEHEDEGFRIARAKNDAIRAAEGKYIHIMDGDTYPGKNTVTAFLPHLDEETVLHGKRWRVDPQVLNAPFSWKILEQYKTRGEWRGEKLHNIPPAPFMHFSGANCIVPAKLAKEFLWAPDNWDGFGFDDYHFALRWIASGRKMNFVDSVAWHLEHPNTEGGAQNRKRLAELQDSLASKLKPIYKNKWRVSLGV